MEKLPQSGESLSLIKEKGKSHGGKLVLGGLADNDKSNSPENFDNKTQPGLYQEAENLTIEMEIINQEGITNKKALIREVQRQNKESPWFSSVDGCMNASLIKL